jgi:hypothetical protein
LIKINRLDISSHQERIREIFLKFPPFEKLQLVGDIMIDFEKIAEIIFFTVELEQTLVFENGFVIDKDNACMFIQNTFDT